MYVRTAIDDVCRCNDTYLEDIKCRNVLEPKKNLPDSLSQEQSVYDAFIMLYKAHLFLNKSKRLSYTASANLEYKF